MRSSRWLKSSRKTSSTRRSDWSLSRTRTVPANAEVLESRMMLASDIMAVMSKGTLTITGTGGTDRVVLEPGVQSGTIRIEVDGTVNGEAGFVELAGLAKDIKIDLGGGNDTLTIQGLTGGNSVPRNLQVDLGDGADVLNIFNTQVNGATKLYLGAGADTVHIDDSKFGKAFSVFGDEGNDALLVERQATFTGSTQFNNKLVAKLGAGNDVIRVGVDGDNTRKASVAKIASIDGGTENDAVSISSNSSGKLKVKNVEGNPPAALPTVAGQLANDTAPGGTTNTDLLTSDPSVQGTITGFATGVILQGGFDNTPSTSFVSLAAAVQNNGTFLITAQTLESLFPGQLTDGTHTLHLRTIDGFGETSDIFNLTFTLDTQAPAVTSFILDPNSDTGTTGDSTTNLSSVTLEGTATPLATVTLFPGGATTTADAQGNFAFANIVLTLGVNTFSAQSVDAAGNASTTLALSITRVPTEPQPAVTAALSHDTAPGGGTNSDGITSDASVSGTVTGQGPALHLAGGIDTAVPGQFVDLSAFLNQNGTFSLTQANLVNLFPGHMGDGAHTLNLQLTDNFGHASSITSLNFTLDTTAPIITTFGLDPATNSGTVDDLVTNFDTVNLIGQTFAGATVTVQPGNLTATANGSGQFTISAVPLNLGDNTFTVQTVDAAGNVSAVVSLTVNRIAVVGEPSLVESWNHAVLEAIRMDNTPPPAASRAMAMVHVAILDAVAAILNEPRFMVSLTAPEGSSAEAAVIGAAYTVLSYLYPAQQAAFDTMRTTSLATLPEDAARAAGETFGQQVAAVVISIRDLDGWDDYVTYSEAPGVGVWQPTAPMYAEALLPQWADLTPFAMTSSDQFRPDGPPDLTSQEWTDAYNEVKDYGAATGSLRTADQTAIARFWADGGGTYTPPGHWNQIASDVASTMGLSLYEDARLFAALNVGLADAGITAWNTKYEYDFWRPIQAIQGGDTDGNDNTTADPNWEPFLISPPFPEYVSGHSTFSGTAAQILTNLLGNVAFTASSIGYRDAQGQPVQRSFDNFWEAAQEAGQSRIYGGIHFQFSNQDGLNAGMQLGDYVTQLFTSVTDTVPPQVQIDSPQNLAVVAGNVTVSGHTFDNLSGIALLELSVDGGGFTPVTVAGDGSFSLLTTFAVNGTADGTHVLQFRATDNVGLQTLKDLTITLDTQDPTLNITGPLSDATLIAGSLLQGTVSGTGSSIVQLNYKFDSGTTVPITFNSATGQFSQALSLAKLLQGAHTLTVQARDAAGHQISQTINVQIDQQIAFSVSSVTPQNGSSDVGTTYRPQVFFTRAVDTATLNANNFYATNAAGQKIPATIVPAADGTFAWLFFTNPLPGGATITVHVEGDTILSAGDHIALDADANGAAGGNKTYSFSTVSLTPLIGTSLSGKLVDPGPDLKPMTFDDIAAGPDGMLNSADDVFKLPIAHVHVFILGLEDQGVFTDAQGNFHFDSVPAGTIKLVVDGRTATNAPDGFYFPEMVMDLQMVAGAANTVMGTMGTNEQRIARRTRQEVYLPRVQSSILQTVSESEATMIGVIPEAAPNLTPEQREQLTLQVEPQSVLGPDGQPLPDAQVGLSTVPPDLVRDMLPPGVMQHTFDITIQAPGAATFSEPLQLTFPNVFNAAPGTKLNFLSFDHTTGRLVIEGTATVSEDGLSVVTDPGFGITKPGWHGLTPPGAPIQGPPPPPEPPPCLTPDQTIETVVDLGVQAVKCAADLAGITGALRNMLSLAEQMRDLIGKVQAAVTAFDSGDRGAGIRATIEALSVSKQGAVTLYDAFQAQNPLGKALAISRCVEDLLTFASNLCGKLTAKPGPCNTIYVRAVCYGIDVAKTTLAQVNNLIAAGDGSAKRMLLTLACAKVDQILALTNVPHGAEVPGDDVGAGADDPVPEDVGPLLQELLDELNIQLSYLEPAEDPTNQLMEDIHTVDGLDLMAAQAAHEVFGNYPDTYYAFSYGNTVVRGRTGPNGQFDVFLPANTDFKLQMYSADRNLLATYNGRTGESGNNVQIPPMPFGGVSTLPDTDGDGLVDDAEFVIGTSVTNVDTDGDNKSDFSEVQQNQNPLDDFLAQSGIVAAQPLQGSAQEIDLQAAGQLDPRLTAYVATGDFGLAIVDLAKPLSPTVRSEIDLPGFATDVAVDPKLLIAAVSTQSGGLQLINVANANSPVLLQTVALNAQRVEVSEGVAYVAGGSTISAVDLLSGEILLTASVSGQITDLRVTGTELFVIDSSSILTSFSLANGEIELQDALTLPAAGGKLFVGGGVAYIGATNGFQGGFVTADVSNPLAMSVLSGVDDASLAGTAMAANGSGTLIVVGNPGGVFGANAADVVSVLDPANTGAFLTRFILPSSPFGVAIGSGIAFVADGTSGLQIVNYLAYDSQGQAPTITWDPNELDRDSGTSGIQVQEGTTLHVNATFADDVQVRSVELLLDGVVVVRDVSYPFDLSAIAPQITETKTTATLQIRATDTGGNVALSPLVTVELNPDIFGPVVVGTSPLEGAARRQIPYLSLRFDEPLDASVISLSDFSLWNLGADGVLGGDDDTLVPVASFVTRSDDRIVVLRLNGELEAGNYQLQVPAGAFTDRAGNPVSDEIALNFTKRPLTVPLTLDTIVSDEFTDPDDFQKYVFQGTAGQKLVFDGINFNTNELAYQLIAPSGATVLNSYYYGTKDSAPVTLLENGTYTLQISAFNNATPEFSFQVLDIAATTSLTLGTQVDGHLDVGSASRYYRFQGTAGLHVFFDGLVDSQTQDYYSGGWAVFSPSNVQLSNNYGYLTYYDMELTLPQDGEYLLAVYGTAADPVDYSFQTYAPTTSVTPVTIGTEFSGAISQPGEVDQFTFSGTAGQAVYFDSLTGSQNGNVALTLLSPHGQVFSNYYYYLDSGPYFLPETGTYTLTIDGYTSYVFDYSYVIVDLATSPALTLDTAVSGPLDPGFSTQYYQFTGTAGQRIYFDGQTDYTTLPHGYYDGGWRLLGPNFQNVFDSGYYYLTYSDQEVTLPADGTYYLEIYGNSDVPLTYEFATITPETTVTPISLNTIVSGEISEPGEIDQFTFTGTAGQLLYLDGLAGDLNLYDIKLIGPHWTIFDDYYYQDNGPFYLPEDGTYTLQFDANGINTAAYGFRLLDLATIAQPMTLETQVTGDIDPGFGTVFYSFTGTAGQHIYFDGLTDSNTVPGGYYAGGWRLLSPTLQNVFDSGIYYLTYSDHEVTLSADGTYYLAIYGNNEDPLTYDFQTYLPNDSTTAINLDSVVTGDLSEPGEVDRFTFEGTAGQRLLLDGLTGDLSKFDIRLVGPHWTLFSDYYYLDYGPFFLPETGTYTIEFDSDGGNTASYSFRMLDLSQPTALTIGQTVMGSVNPAGSLQVYHFSGLAGQTILFDGQSDSGSISYYSGAWSLWGPGNQNLFNNYGYLSFYDSTVTLTQDGDYYLIVAGEEGVTANYQFATALQSFDPPTVDPATPLTLNDTVSGDISPADEVDRYSFTGAVGQQLIFDAQNFDMNLVGWTLKAPNGVVIDQRYGYWQDPNSEVITLPEPGTYVLEIFGQNVDTASYSFRLIDLLAGSDPLTLDTVVSDTIDPGTEMHVYRFDGTRGQRIFFDGLNDSNVVDYYAGGWRLRGPGGEDVFNSYGYLTYTDHEVTLPQTGTYYLIVYGTNGTSYDYSFQTFTSTDSSSALTLNATTSGDISSSGERDVFTFTGAPGQKVLFDALDFDMSQVTWVLTAPSGNVVDQRYGYWQDANSDVLILSEPGTYTLVIDGQGIATPGYSFRLLDLATYADPLVLDTTVTAMADPGQEVHVYQFTGTKGQRIEFDGLNSSETEYNTGGWMLRGPGNENLFNNYGYITYYDAEITLPQDGTYYVVVYGTSADPHEFSFRTITSVDSVTPLTLGQVVTGDISNGGEIDSYTFTGVVGQRVLFDALVGDLDQYDWRLIAPSGTVVDQRYGYWQNSNSDIIILPEPGLYTLVIDGDGIETPSYSFRLLDVAAIALPLTLGEVVNGSLVDGNETIIYQFTGTAGQHVYFDGLNDSDIDYYAGGWLLRGPGNQHLFDNYGYLTYYDDDITLPQDGTYYLVVYGSSDTPQDFSFQTLLPADSNQSLTLDTITSGSMDVNGEIDTYTFSGVPGQRIYFDSTDLSQVDAYFELRSPSGNYVFGLYSNYYWYYQDAGPYVLSEAGTYTLKVTHQDSTPGTYQFNLRDAAQFPVLPLNETTTSSLPAGGANAVFRFQGVAGQFVSIAVSSDDDNYYYWYLYGADGSNIGTIYDESSVDFVLPGTGTYLLVSVGDFREAASTYTVTTSSPAMALTSTYSGPESATATSISTTDPALLSLFNAAKAQWSQLASDPRLDDILAGITFRVADLASGILGYTQGAEVVIDINGGGQGWFIDPTPADDSEFASMPAGVDQAATTGASRGGVDLLTVLSHEIGHVLGLDHASAGLMQGSLSAGVRREVSASDLDAVFADGIL